MSFDRQPRLRIEDAGIIPRQASATAHPQRSTAKPASFDRPRTPSTVYPDRNVNVATANPRRPRQGRPDMKERIYAATVEFLVAHGYSDFNFGLLAKKLHTTRANVHYHFVNKSTLIDYVVERYTQSIIDRWTDIWGSDKSYEAKVELAITFTRELFERYNPKSGDGSKPWSLISRMREDYRLLSEPSRRRLKAFTQSLEELIDKSVRSAQSKGELGASIDPEDIVLQMSAIIDNSPSITRIAGGHGKLERLYRSHLRLIGLGQHKASTRTRSPPPPPSLDSRPS